MELRSFRHKAVRRLFVEGTGKGLDAQVVARLGRMLAFIDAASSPKMLELPPNYGFHRLTGDRAGSCAMTVTRNWRLTFVVVDENAVADIDLEDYH